MKNKLEQELSKFIKDVLKVKDFNLVLQVPKSKDNGDISTPIAMALAKKLGKSPVVIANQIKDEFKSDIVSKIDVAGPGFINFFVDESNIFETINNVAKLKENFGKGKPNGERINVEFISANPTGWLHIGHARNAAYGSSLINVMRFAGCHIDAEYYINDAGSQMNNLKLSVIERYKELCGEKINLDGGDLYKGQDIVECAKLLHKEKGDSLLSKIDDEKVQDEILEFSYGYTLRTIKEHLKEFNIDIEKWSSERELFKKDLVDQAIKRLKKQDAIYEQDGATFCKTTLIKDDKDRVIIKADKSPTYFCSDIAYHNEKALSNVDKLINVWGADHDGYVDRVKSAMQLLGYDKDFLEIELMQLVKVQRDGVEVKMSKRMGTSITIKEMLDEIGADALRYFLVSRTQNSNMIIDMNKVTEKNSENPLFYVQYAHARCCSIIEKSEVKSSNKFDLLKNEIEGEIVKFISTFPDVVQSASLNREPHKITNFVYDLASKFHSYYNANKVVTEDKELTAQRVAFINSIRQTLANALTLIGVSAPIKM